MGRMTVHEQMQARAIANLHREEAESITPVVFRWWEHSVIALFPTLHDDPDPSLCDSYQHIGQHGSARYQHIINTSRPATPAEYASLKKELESAPYHYHFKVYQRRPAR